MGCGSKNGCQKDMSENVGQHAQNLSIILGPIQNINEGEGKGGGWVGEC